MKKVFAIILMLFSFQVIQAQLFTGERLINSPNIDNQRWSFGYYLGFNSYDFDFDYIDYDPSPVTGANFALEKRVGFNVGLVANLRINKNIDIRLEPGVNFSTRGFQALRADPNTFREINSTYVHIPLLLKFSTNRLNNFRPFVVGGLSTSINLSSNENNPDDYNAGQFRMTTNSYYYEVGFGIDLYLYYFKFSPSIRGVFAINDELIRDENPSFPFTANVDKMSSRAIFINFTFQ